MQGTSGPPVQAAPWQSSGSGGGGSGGGGSGSHHHHHRMRENPHHGTGPDIEVQVPGDQRIRWALGQAEQVEGGAGRCQAVAGCSTGRAA
jgi:hypothetical protein